MTSARAVLLVGATMTTGLMAGAFALYAHTIMPGLRHTDDRTFVAAFQSIDRAIINPWFMATAFVGALVLVSLAAISQLGRPAQPWVLAALVLYLVAVVITATVHVPANDAIKAAGDVAGIPDLAAVRASFDETRWSAWNLVRTLTTTAAFGSLCWALLVHGQAAAGAAR